MKTSKIIFWLFPAVVCYSFALLFYLYRTDFSISAVNAPQNLNRFLKNFFNEVCTKGFQPDTHYVERIRQGCSYHYSPAASVNDSYRLEYLNVAADEFRFHFESYKDGILNIRYSVGPLYRSTPIDLDQEEGILSMDLSKYEVPGDNILVKFTPHIPFSDFLIKPIEVQPSWEELTKKTRFGWGTVLTYKLLSLSQARPEQNTSMTIGRENSFFLTSSDKVSYHAIRDYFEKGSMDYFAFADFAYFSASILTSSALGDMVPSTLAMKTAISIESLVGIIWLALAGGLGFELLRNHLQ